MPLRGGGVHTIALGRKPSNAMQQGVWLLLCDKQTLNCIEFVADDGSNRPQAVIQQHPFSSCIGGQGTLPNEQ